MRAAPITCDSVFYATQGKSARESTDEKNKKMFEGIQIQIGVAAVSAVAGALLTWLASRNRNAENNDALDDLKTADANLFSRVSAVEKEVAAMKADRKNDSENIVRILNKLDAWEKRFWEK